MSTDLLDQTLNFLRPNGHGGYLIRQSDLSTFARCGMLKFYEDRARNVPMADQPAALSITTYGTICHHAMQVVFTKIDEGMSVDEAIAIGVKTFEYYWENPAELGERITEWLPFQTYGGLRERGRQAIRDLTQVLVKEDHTLLALEYQFAVPFATNGRLHTITGTIDRLTVRKVAGKPYLSIDDLKFGKQPTYLRYNMQGTVYSWATTQKEFWVGWRDSGMGELATFPDQTIDNLAGGFASHGYRLIDHQDGAAKDLPLASRKFRWINGQEIKIGDGGWRNARDYARMGLAIDSYVAALENGIYPINQIGEVCRHCAFRKTCGGIGLPDEEAGAP